MGFSRERRLEDGAAPGRISQPGAPLGLVGGTPDGPAPDDLVGASSAMQSLRQGIEVYAPSDAPVLVLGETGTGKELVARRLHARSARSNRPLVAVNCAAIPELLFESELFGAARGAFTGAIRDRPGLLREAHGGTLFLDEIAELPLPAQAKLLRVLESGRLRRLGGVGEEVVDVRVIAATHRDLRARVEDGRFRADLYYRLNVLRMVVPSLAERRRDVPALLVRLASQLLRPGERVLVARGAIEALEQADLPGNVRELRNVLQRSLVRAGPGGFVEAFELDEEPLVREAAGRGDGASRVGDGQPRLVAALARSGGRLEPVARELCVSVRTVQRRMKALGLSRSDFTLRTATGSVRRCRSPEHAASPY